MFYLYKLLDPITNDVKYVGYSKNPKKRIWEVLYFDKVSDAVKFTGVNSNQINKLIKLNKKSKKGFLFEKIIHELSI